MIRFAAALVAAVVLAAGCDSNVPKTAPTVAPAAPGNPRADAARLASAGDYAGAERKYREALAADPDDLELHFGLGSVLTQLDRPDEAAEQFRWVVANGRSGRPEVDSARRWLAEAGDASVKPAAAPTPDAATMGTIAGKLTWPGIPPEKEFGIRVLLVREGENSIFKSARTRLNGTYTIADLPEGSYKLIGLAGPTRIWSDLPITVVSGRETRIDLSPANAVVSATEFPARIR